MNYQVLLLLLALIIPSIKSVDEAEVDYFVSLIDREIRRTNTFQLPTSAREFEPNRTGRRVGTWDYIIIGAGSAGAVIASRLSEDPNNQVLLIEAGGFENDFTDIPLMSTYQQQLEFNWNFKSTPQTNCFFGMINNQSTIPKGRGLGGTSLINNVKYTRGNKNDYNSWFRQGNPGWSYNQVLPIFKKFENVQFPADLNYHGTNGNLTVEHERPMHPQMKAFIEANEYLGRPLVDFNAQRQLGVGITQFNTNNGRRLSSARAFLFPALIRPNLKVSTHSLATRILFSKKDAIGVQFSKNGQIDTAHVRKEIISSAGVIGSPQLLMLSGIGPVDHLSQLDIPVIKDLQVGSNLQDHLGYFELHFLTNYSEPIRTLRENVKRYLNDLSPFTVSTHSHGLAFVQTKFNSLLVPDIEIIMNPSNLSVTNTEQISNYKNDVFDALWNNVNERQSFRMYVVLLHERSRGTVRLQSKSPFDYPLIDLNFFSDPQGCDIETLYQGMQMALQLAATPPFQKMNTTLVYNPVPACKHLTYLSREFWYCQIRQVAYNFNHQVGTCQMGPNLNDVVDPKLRVHGVNNLRVADASIMPFVTSGHTSSASMMIGEKASEMIKQSNE